MALKRRLIGKIIVTFFVLTTITVINGRPEKDPGPSTSETQQLPINLDQSPSQTQAVPKSSIIQSDEDYWGDFLNKFAEKNKDEIRNRLKTFDQSPSEIPQVPKNPSTSSFQIKQVPTEPPSTSEVQQLPINLDQFPTQNQKVPKNLDQSPTQTQQVPKNLDQSQTQTQQVPKKHPKFLKLAHLPTEHIKLPKLPHLPKSLHHLKRQTKPPFTSETQQVPINLDQSPSESQRVPISNSRILSYPDISTSLQHLRRQTSSCHQSSVAEDRRPPGTLIH